MVLGGGGDDRSGEIVEETPKGRRTLRNKRVEEMFVQAHQIHVLSKRRIMWLWPLSLQNIIMASVRSTE
ncbi:uncharacterized protein BDCG_16621 [Blastomyces dermatitidis ER-3]|uniref:Uncharacterized protein n=2 Tax=Blastomyces TaxID=229219 RepID=A0A179UNM9_BLAGS|nr:uncharacterized protein BDBG_05428 [Blastomyces gilchristii SLH14081]XP_045280173.1 uncharacterized protein BDCG_16621 [Blastomyces dermatitidis ER-3]EQL32681.1 hypothetical protein BDFG_05220 [Blastomyces dermatitidis ATCC 26199]OAT00446.1 hypothetical protein BDCG_16621 [Blastomyces dermatitidis ER-3]OAT09696.1 hypothetical protein BDBG_05428 [Blastomyces gilchristii SLH14081]